MRRKSAFTLLELLIAAVVIVALASVAVPRYRGSVLRAEVAKARHAMALIAEAEQIIRSETGNFVNVPNPANLDNRIGTNVSGIDLRSVQNDQMWLYTVQGGVVTAQKQTGFCSGAQPANSVTLDLNTGVFAEGGCF
ncbi:MAG: prepilin-type N-terminal cleavage/methylation domain-containing protein [Candidatus Omnitrophica bacterium]|nr:prepilin-type N-terminal cleavage/methylation domain-containing protein [Candidatus Omnitrophota bacterium]